MVSSAPALALAGQSVGISTIPNPQHILPMAANAATTCPNYNGLLDSISVPVSHQISLYVVIFQPAPKGGATFQLSSDNPSIAAAGDIKQAFLPKVFIPEGQTYSNPFSIFGISVGATQLRITPLTSGFVQSAFPLGAWDVNQAGNQKFVDANPPVNHCRVSDSSNDLSTDAAVLASCGSTVRNGISADGASQFLMRTISGLPGTVCFQITSQSNFDQGALQDSVVQTQTVSGREYGFTYYKAPDSFGDTVSFRPLEIEFTFTPSIGNGNTSSFRAQTQIVRPPVLLVHGIWSKGSAWSGIYIPKDDPFHTTYVADYEATNGAGFSNNFPRVQDFVKRAIDNARAKGYAVTQTDVIGHSMGGILTRLYIGSNTFQRPDNFGKGDIRRLLTLDTPHSGSTFANLVAALHRVNATEADKAVRSITGYAPDGGAVCDLAENSPALQGLNNPTTILGQSITGTGGPAVGTYDAVSAKFFGGVLGIGNIEGTLTNTRCLHRNILFSCDQREFIFPQDIINGFRFRQGNDTIVALSSQQGGLAGINFPDVIHSGPFFVNGVLSSSSVATRAYQLLDGPPSIFENSFPGIGSSGSGVPITVPGRGAAQDQQDYSNQCGPGGPLQPAASAINQRFAAALQQASVPDSRVQMISPADGRIFAPGDTVNITVKLTPPLIANNIAVDMTEGFGELEGTNYDGTQYQAIFVIPDFFAGPLILTPDITDTNNIPILGAPITIAVRPATPPIDIAFRQKNFRITLPTTNPSESLALMGTYDGPIEYDMTSSVTGTSYQTTNPAVVKVNNEGIYQIMGSGTAVVTASNSGLKDFAAFVVEDPVNPLQPEDVSAQFSIQESGFRLDRTKGFFVQSVSMTNNEPIPAPGPLYLLISGLPAGVNLVNQSGITQNIQMGTPYITLPLSSDGLNLQPGQSITLTLQFLNPTRTNIGYIATVWRTAGVP